MLHQVCTFYENSQEIVMIKQLERLYEAPSTANENLGDPLLEIGGQQDLELISPDVFLPEQIFVSVRPTPVISQFNGKVFMQVTDEMPALPSSSISLYQDAKALTSINFINAYCHDYVLHGERYAINKLSPYGFDKEVLSSWDFKMPANRTIVLLNHEPLPYGAVFNVDPKQCFQRKFQVFLDSETDIKVNIIDRRDLSLDSVIKAHGLTIELIFEDDIYLYRSISYEIKENDTLLICFVP